MPKTMDPNVILVGAKEYATCGNAECDFLVLAWLNVNTNDLNAARDVRDIETDAGKVNCVPLVVPSGGDMFCSACGDFVMHGVFCRETADHPGLGTPHPHFADLI